MGLLYNIVGLGGLRWIWCIWHEKLPLSQRRGFAQTFQNALQKTISRACKLLFCVGFVLKMTIYLAMFVLFYIGDKLYLSGQEVFFD